MGSPNQLGRNGIRPSTFKPGTKVTCACVRCATARRPPASSGEKFEDGKTVGNYK